jgi:hypothetical protein
MSSNLLLKVNLLDLAVAAFICGYGLLLWLNTNAFFEYVSLLLRPFIRYCRWLRDYDELKDKGYDGTFVNFLTQYGPAKGLAGFFARLITCPICLSVWLGIFSRLLTTCSSVEAALLAALTLLSYLVFNKML